MALSVATNTGALMAQAAASSVNKEMETSMERLSTGKRINSAADDAAGVAIASRLTAEIKGTNQAIRNAMDGQAMIDTAEGAHIEITTLLQRMREIAVQAANDTNDSNDRNNLEVEYEQLVEEVDRIAQVTSWAGKNLLNGTGSGTGNAEFNFQIGSGTNGADTVKATIGSMRGSVLDIAKSYADSDTTAEITSNSTGVAATATNVTAAKVTLSDFASGTGSYTVKIDGVLVTQATTSSQGKTAIGAAMATTMGSTLASRYTVSATDGVVTIYKAAVAEADVELDDTTKAQAMVTKLDTALQTVADQRAKLGSLTNRLDSTVSNLTNAVSNLAAGKGRIEDADFAAETTNLAKTQILQQASTAMLAQANASKQNVLSLLQG